MLCFVDEIADWSDSNQVPEPVEGEPGMVWCPACEGNCTVSVCPPNCQGHQNDYEVPCPACHGLGKIEAEPVWDEPEPDDDLRQQWAQADLDRWSR